MRLSTVTVLGTEYSACFSLRASMHTAERYGSLKAVFDETREAKSLEMKVWLLAEMLKAGYTAAKAEEVPAKVPPTFDELLDKLDGFAVSEITEMILQVLAESQKTTVQIEDDEKNAVATTGP